MKDKRRNGYMNICKRSKGFTLVELIVVLVIIVILAALAVPALFGFIDGMHKKQVIARAQTALSATQSALSDIYSSNDNKYTIQKREQTRLNAGAGEETAFTVWNVRTLYDEPVEESPATVAVIDEIGSYTIGKAIYKDDNTDYAAYNGVEWDVFDTKELAEGFIELKPEEASSVIYVWPYSEDFALMPDGPKKPDPDDLPPIVPDPQKEKYVTLKHNPKTFFAMETDSENALPDESITITFYDDGSNDHGWKDNAVNRFKDKLIACLPGFSILSWNEENTDFVAKIANNPVRSISQYIFSEQNEDKDHFTFIVDVEGSKDSATLSKADFKGYIKDKTVTSCQWVDDCDKSVFKRVDDKTTEKEIWAYVNGGVLQWWSDAEVKFLPENCDRLLTDIGGKVSGFSFDGYDAYKVKSAKELAMKNTGLKNIDFGGGFYAPNLTTLKEAFSGASGITTLDMSGIAKLGKTMELEAAFNGMSNLTGIQFGEGFRTTRIDKSLKNLFCNDSKLGAVDLSGWNVTRVTDMERSFYGCSNLSLDDKSFEGWSLDDCRSLLYTFYGCGEKVEHKTNLSDFSAGASGNLITIAECFKKTTFTELELGGINVTNVTNFRSTFSDCTKLTSLNISNWKPSNVVNMMQAFKNCYVVEEIDLSGWKLVNLDNLYQTFYGCKNANIITTHWNENGYRPEGGKLRSLMDAFRDCNKLESINLDDWNVTGLKTKYVLEDTGEYTGHSNWLDVDGALKNIFWNCRSLTNISLRNWNLNNIEEDPSNVLRGCNALKTLNLEGFIYDKDKLPDYFVLSKSSSDVKGSLETLVLTNAHFNGLDDISALLKNHTKLTRVVMTGMTATDADSAKELFSGCTNLDTVIINGADFKEVTDVSSMFLNCNKLKEVDMSGCNLSTLTNMASLFEGCRSLTRVTLSGMKTAAVRDISKMFKGCSSITSIDMSSMETGSVTDMSGLFSDCTLLKSITLSGMDTSSVKNMNSMFKNCSSLASVDLSGMDAREVTDMGNMFYGCSSIKSIDMSSMKTPKVKDMSGLFSNCTSLMNLTLAGMDTSSLENMNSMFKNCSSLASIDLSGMTAPKVTDMGELFSGCSSIQSIDMSGMDVRKVTDMSGLFSNCTSLKNLTLAGMNTASLKKMNSMFMNCASLVNVDLSGINTALVEDMSNLFYGCSAMKKLDLSGLDVTAVTQMKDMVKGMTSLEEIDLSNWDLRSMAFPTGENTSFFVDTKKSLKKVKMENIKLDGTISLEKLFFNKSGVTSVLEEVSLKGADLSNVTAMNDMFTRCKNLKKVDFSGIITPKVTAVNSMFKECSALEAVDFTGMDFSKVTTVNQMFNSCISLKELNASGWKMKNLSNIDLFLGNCTSLETVNISGWESGVFAKNIFSAAKTKLEYVDMSDCVFSNISDMSEMFNGYTALTTVNMAGIDLPKVTNMSKMFYTCTKLEKIDFGEELLDFSKVTTMQSMFAGCYHLKDADMSRIYTSVALVNTERMFEGCYRLQVIDLENLNMTKVTNMKSMFSMGNAMRANSDFVYECAITSVTFGPDCTTESVTGDNYTFMFDNCISLTTITVKNSRFDLSGKAKKSMFANATKLVGGNGTAFSTDQSNYARVDADGTPGYFTAGY